MKTESRTLDGNLATATIAYKTNEVCAIYPITPSSGMSELVEEWSAYDKTNIFGSVPTTIQMQSEAGVAGLLHGALQTGSLATSFTSSQGLLLMLPNMFRIAGELTPNVIHVATRSIATHALSVFGDHSDVMAVRSSGYAMLASANVQEAMDFALIAQAATLQSRIPFVHFFDGFRTSHETNTVSEIADNTIKKMMNLDLIQEHRDRALSPENPFIRGTAQNADTFFQSREAINTYYNRCPAIVQEQMDSFAKLTGRNYRLFDYIGHPEAERVIVTMASSTDVVERTVDYLLKRGEKVGLIKVRLFRPFSVTHLLEALPASCRSIAVLDRTKEAGAAAEPLFMDVAHAIQQNPLHSSTRLKVVGGRYGLSSREFNPAMVQAVFDNLKKEAPLNNFSVGILDDVTKLNLPVDESFKIDAPFYEVLIVEAKTAEAATARESLVQDLSKKQGGYIQLYSETDYKKADAYITTNLRIGTAPIAAPYLITDADLLVIDNIGQLSEGLLSRLRSGGKILVKEKFSTPSIQKTILNQLIALNSMPTSNNSTALIDLIQEGKGSQIPVSMLPVDGTFPSNTASLKSKAAGELSPDWNAATCTQCGLCSLSCPQAAIRMNVFESSHLDGAPSDFQFADAKEPKWEEQGMKFSLQVLADQCDSCGVCIDACDADALKLTDKLETAEVDKSNLVFFDNIPTVSPTEIDPFVLSQQQLQVPLFTHHSGDKSCGEAPYLKLLSQLFGDRMLVANATGSSSIFGGALPTTPWSKDENGRGPAWSNSLFEDNAEFGLGFRVSLNQKKRQARKLLLELPDLIPSKLATALLEAPQNTATEVEAQRARVLQLKEALSSSTVFEARNLLNIADSFVDKSVWLVGGDGWAYDCGFSGLDHVLATGANVNILVLDNEVYSNTGGQVSKSTPYGASGKFAARGKKKQKKDLARLAMTYEDVYVGTVAMGADPEQTLKTFLEAERFEGPSLIIAYCHSPAHGIDLSSPRQYHIAAVATGQWPLFRHDPSKSVEPVFQLDSAEPSVAIEEYLRMEKRFDLLFENAESQEEVMSVVQNRIDAQFTRLEGFSQLM